MSTPESCSESGEEARMIVTQILILNCFEKIEDSEGQPPVDDNVKSQAASSSATSLADSHLSEAQDMANKNMDDEARCRKKLDPYGEIWKKWALDLIMDSIFFFFLINVAGYYGNAKDSGIGVLIRNRQGIPIAACSYYEANNEKRVSPFFQELRAVSKSLDMADKLNLKYIHIICTSTDVSYAITSTCDRGAPLEDGNHRVHGLSLEIIDKLPKRRDKYP
ncbi:hypothetical protein MKX03_021251 [Papaver bracteatum]|nr:hypothetical protein MKX03_021251 [Papaver bracteatum]